MPINPTVSPPRDPQGLEVNDESSHMPIAIPPRVGANIRQVVSAAIMNKTSPADFCDLTSDGFDLSLLLCFAAALIS